jgi:hypothetical protein
MTSSGDDLFRKRTGTDEGGPDPAPPGPVPGQYPPPYAGPGGHYPPPGGYPPPQGYGPYGAPGGYGPPKPSSNLGWAIVAVLFFWPLAIPAFINYARIDDLWWRGDLAGAERASMLTRRFGIIALAVGIAVAVLAVLLAVVVGVTVATHTNQPPNFPAHPFRLHVGPLH